MRRFLLSFRFIYGLRTLAGPVPSASADAAIRRAERDRRPSLVGPGDRRRAISSAKGRVPAPSSQPAEAAVAVGGLLLRGDASIVLGAGC